MASENYFRVSVDEEKLSAQEIGLIEEAGKQGGIERTFLERSEIKIANSLVKRGYLRKGHADTRQGNVSFYTTGKA